MNILGLVFSLLLILSYAFFACWEKACASHRLRSTYLGHELVSRKILLQYERKLYEGLRKKRPIHELAAPSSEAEEEPQEERPLSTPSPKTAPFNLPCARLNLMPLIQQGIPEGREAHPLLYELAGTLLRVFYRAPLFEGKPLEPQFLGELLAAAQASLEKGTPFVLEKLAFKDPQRQPLFYKMLKGTKEWDLPSHAGYPTLIDYIKFEPSEEKICLFHAHPDLLALLFGPRAAPKLFEEMHRKEAPPITREKIEQICSESDLTSLNPDLFELLQLGRPSHEPDEKITFVEQDAATHISLRKTVAAPPSQ